MELIIATHNEGKANELKNFLKLFKITGISLNELNVTEDVEENGKTFKDNALIKANFFSKLTNKPCIADDGGIEIDALNGEPGVKSRRWKGYRMTDQELVDYTLERLQDVPPEQRTCRLVSVLALCQPEQEPIFGTGTIEGSITEKQTIPFEEGYPFRAIFYVPKFNKMLGELTPSEHETINHRFEALKQVISQLQIST